MVIISLMIPLKTLTFIIIFFSYHQQVVEPDTKTTLAIGYIAT